MTKAVLPVKFWPENAGDLSVIAGNQLAGKTLTLEGEQARNAWKAYVEQRKEHRNVIWRYHNKIYAVDVFPQFFAAAI